MTRHAARALGLADRGDDRRRPARRPRALGHRGARGARVQDRRNPCAGIVRGGRSSSGREHEALRHRPRRFAARHRRPACRHARAGDARRPSHARGARAARHRLARREALRIRARSEARRSWWRRTRATSSTSIAIPQALRSTRGRTTPSSARRARSRTSRSTRRCRSRTRRDRGAARRVFRPVPRLAGGGDRARARAPRPRGPARRPLDPLRRCRDSSRAGCPISISAPPTARAARRRCRRLAAGILGAAAGFTHVVNGRFKGGYVTRHYGRPAEHVHALQLEIAQACYMDEAPPCPWDADRAAALEAVLARLVDALLAWRPQAIG